MCFSAEMSLGFSIAGILFTVWCFYSNGNMNIVKGVGWFVLMELLQFVQYQFIATDIDPENPTFEQMQQSQTCRSSMNRFLTLLGFIHIAFQPYFSACMSCALVQRAESVAQFKLVHRLQLWGAALLLGRHFLTYFDGKDFEMLGFDAKYAFDPKKWVPSVEWLSGPALCTYAGKTHLAWSVPFVDHSYYVPAMQLHAFLMFVPFFTLDFGGFFKNYRNWIAGFLLFITGPFLGDWFTANKHEAASIWCFFSICQVVGLVCILVAGAHSKGKWFKNRVGKQH